MQTMREQEGRRGFKQEKEEETIIFKKEQFKRQQNNQREQRYTDWRSNRYSPAKYLICGSMFIFLHLFVRDYV